MLLSLVIYTTVGEKQESRVGDSKTLQGEQSSFLCGGVLFGLILSSNEREHELCIHASGYSPSTGPLDRIVEC